MAVCCLEAGVGWREGIPVFLLRHVHFSRFHVRRPIWNDKFSVFVISRRLTDINDITIYY